MALGLDDDPGGEEERERRRNRKRDQIQELRKQMKRQNNVSSGLKIVKKGLAYPPSARERCRQKSEQLLNTIEEDIIPPPHSNTQEINRNPLKVNPLKDVLRDHRNKARECRI